MQFSGNREFSTVGKIQFPGNGTLEKLFLEKFSGGIVPFPGSLLPNSNFLFLKVRWNSQIPGSFFLTEKIPGSNFSFKTGFSRLTKFFYFRKFDLVTKFIIFSLRSWPGIFFHPFSSYYIFRKLDYLFSWKIGNLGNV